MKRVIITEEDMRMAAMDFDSYEVNENLLDEIEREAKETELILYYEDLIKEFNRQ